MGYGMKTTVYRVEKNGKGPYYHSRKGMSDALKDELGGHNGDNKRPGPYSGGFDDEMSKLRAKHEKDVLFGFDSMEQLRAWFHDWVIDLLKEAGYVIKKYKVAVEDVYVSCYQAIFTNGELV
jgi:hypothetical protein